MAVLKLERRFIISLTVIAGVSMRRFVPVVLPLLTRLRFLPDVTKTRPGAARSGQLRSSHRRSRRVPGALFDSLWVGIVDGQFRVMHQRLD